MKAIRKFLPWLSLPLVVAVAALLGYSWYRVDLLPADPNATTSVAFHLPKGESPNTTAKRLEQQRLIRSRTAFLIYLAAHGLRGRVQSGDYTLKASYNAEDTIDILTNGKVAVNRLTIPEGSTLKQVRQLAATKGIKTEDFDAAASGNFGKTFLVGRPAGITLEGYLFPDTYELGTGATAQKLLTQMLDNFDRQVTPDLRQAFTAQGLSLHKAVTLASIVEKEVPNTADRQLVAGVFFHRLQLKMPLESDVTVHYAADLTGQPFSTALDSPYNTYLNPGLPPGPICNPGLDSLRAVAAPTDTDYLYFVAGSDGKTHFAKTFAEHQQNVQKYLR